MAHTIRVVDQQYSICGVGYTCHHCGKPLRPRSAIMTIQLRYTNTITKKSTIHVRRVHTECVGKRSH